jgi:hypothetical protein
MGAIKMLFTLGLLVLNFIGALFLLTKAGGIPFYLEIVYLLVAIFATLIFLAGLVFEAKWAWPLATILFAVNLANAVCLYIVIGALLTFVLMVIISSIGILTAMLSINDEKEDADLGIPETPVETYAEDEKVSKKNRK